MPTSLPISTKSPGDVLTSALWNTQVRDSLNKILNTGHRTLTVAQFAALGAPEGTKGVVAGDEVYLEVDATNGILWHIVFESTESVYKWRYLGGPPMVSEIATSEATTSLTYVDLATVLSLTLPRGGDYVIDSGFAGANSSSGFNYIASVKLGAAATADAEFALGYAAAAASTTNHHRRMRRNGFAASDAVKQQYKTNGGTMTASNRHLSVTPARLI